MFCATPLNFREIASLDVIAALLGILKKVKESDDSHESMTSKDKRIF